MKPTTRDAIQKAIDAFQCLREVDSGALRYDSMLIASQEVLRAALRDDPVEEVKIVQAAKDMSPEALGSGALYEAVSHSKLKYNPKPEMDEFIRDTLCDVAQVFDGWHSDGTAWSEWDETVRRRVSKCLSMLGPPATRKQDEQEENG